MRPASQLVRRWRVRLWLTAVHLAERQLRKAYDQLVDAEERARVSE